MFANERIPTETISEPVLIQVGVGLDGFYIEMTSCSIFTTW